MNINIGEVLSRAWQIIWRHKVLWIFGILSGCANSGGGGNFNISNQRQAPEQMQRFFSDMPQGQLIALVVIAILVVLFLVILVIFLGTIGRIGLIRGAKQADQGTERLAFGELFSGSMPYFWRVFLLNLLVGLAFALAIIALAVFGLIGTIFTLGIALICLIPMICLLVPVAWAIGLLVEQSSIAIVVENLGIMDGLRRGWEVIKANAGTMVVMWLILVLGIGLIGGLIIGLPFALIAIPALFALFSEGEVALRGGLLISAICLVAYLPFLIVLSGILRSYIGSAWTLTFLRLTTPAQSQVEVLAEPVA